MYRITSGLGIVGLTAGTFASTVITNEYGGVRYGALVTAGWIVFLVAGRLLVAPYAPLAIRKFGPRRTFLTVKVLSVVLWILLGILLAMGSVGALSLYATAPIVGAIAAFASTLTTLYSGAYINGHDMSGALARRAVVRGGGIAVGAFVAGVLVLTVGPAWAIMARGALEIPLIIVLLFFRPGEEPASPQADRQVWRGLRDDLRSNPGLRLLVILGMGLTIFAMPFSELLVPIITQLRASDAVPGAALMVASIALGQSFSIFPVDFLKDRFVTGVSAALMGGVRGLALLAFGLSALVATGGWELAVWAVIGCAFGAARAASGALMAGATMASVIKEDGSRALVAFTFACTLTSPIGVLLWGTLIAVVGLEWTLLVGAVGVLSVSWYVLRRARSTSLGAAADLHRTP
jgi:hypothetical protein